MADLNGVNFQLTQNFPAEKAKPGQINGRVKSLSEKYTMIAALAVNDEILGPKLPGGARVIDATITIDKSLGATGILDLGHKASEDLDGNTLAEDQNAFINQADGGGQAVFQRMGSSASNIEAGYNQEFGTEAQVYAKCTELSVVTDAVIEFHILYVID